MILILNKRVACILQVCRPSAILAANQLHRLPTCLQGQPGVTTPLPGGDQKPPAGYDVAEHADGDMTAALEMQQTLAAHNQQEQDAVDAQ